MTTTCKKFPDFCIPAVVNMKIQKIKLSDFKKKNIGIKNITLISIVFLFYPNDFSFVCPTEILAFDDKYEDFKKRNTELIVISGDSVYSHLQWQNVKHADGGIGKLKCIHAADFTHDLIKSLGIYYMNEKDVDNSNGGCYRALYIVDTDGNVCQTLINDNSIGRSVDECLRTLDVIDHVKKTGNVCEANWKKGNK